MSRRHVVLVTYGEPPTASFGAQLRYSWRILLGLTRSVAPIPIPLLPWIAFSRARFRTRLWTTERYGSPLEPITRDQAAGLVLALASVAPGTDWRVHVAYEFRDPTLLATVCLLPDDEPVDVMPAYVADSAFTHEIARSTLARWPGGRARRAPLRVLPPLDEEILADLCARHVITEAARRNAVGPEWGVVLAAHGTLLEPRRPIETGRVATERIAARIAAHLTGHFGAVRLGWLNHVYGGRWTGPPVEVALRRMVEAGFRRLVYFPFGFSADNAESELEGRIALRAAPELESIHLPCLNAAPEYLEALARQLACAIPAHGISSVDSFAGRG
ncbi:MAG: ferrochelatase [Candidatus Eisenbacteria bacterium]|nr:ferrochelatase [Candidatus Eisenbacteria bacterium]